MLYIATISKILKTSSIPVTTAYIYTMHRVYCVPMCVYMCVNVYVHSTKYAFMLIFMYIVCEHLKIMLKIKNILCGFKNKKFFCICFISFVT